MPPRLEDLAGAVRFPLSLLPPHLWRGEVFVGDVRSLAGEIRAVQLVYISPGSDAGLLVSNLAKALNVEDPARLTDHLTSFVSHFDPAYLTHRAKRGRFVPFPPRDWQQDEILISLAGASAAQRFRHRRLPLTAYRAAIVRGAVMADLCVAGWGLDPADRLSDICAVGPANARAFDAAACA